MRRRLHHTKLDDRWHQERRHDDVGRRGRHAHAEDDAGAHRKDQRDQQRILGQRDHELGEHDAESAECHHRDDDAGAGARERHRQTVASPVTQRFDDIPESHITACRLSQQRHWEASERAGQCRQRCTIAGIEYEQDDQHRNEQVAALAQHISHARQLRTRNANDAASLGLEVHRGKAGKII